MKPRRPRFFPNLPRLCAGEETDLLGGCLACGAKLDELCRAPAAVRYKPAGPIR